MASSTVVCAVALFLGGLVVQAHIHETQETVYEIREKRGLAQLPHDPVITGIKEREKEGGRNTHTKHKKTRPEATNQTTPDLDLDLW